MQAERNHTLLIGLVALALLCSSVAAWLLIDEPPADDDDDGQSDAADLTQTHPIESMNVFELHRLLRDPIATRDVKHKAVARLASLTAFKEFQTQIGEMGGISILVDLLRQVLHDDSGDRDEAFTCALLLAMSNLTVHVTNHTLLHIEGAEAVAASIYESHASSIAVRLGSLRLLSNLSMWDASRDVVRTLPVIHTLAGDLLSSSRGNKDHGEANEDTASSNAILKLFVNLTDKAHGQVDTNAAYESILDATTGFCLSCGDQLSAWEVETSGYILRHLAAFGNVVVRRPESLCNPHVAPGKTKLERSLRCLHAFDLLDNDIMSNA
ncbi:Aste57867_15528 [Aphanomyces stellatus]|uniref:Aste57867_15528 protein n=1 Tax=Aphanomyces stellatus TaxID=120398 RepID=A0A485L698_9STRA|nr:hypothetical protein As57867_015472 [Aphanomyces stellatus]VFT92330.1 Aste57867_15528 [Aphanomyces stellatus]